MVDTNIEGDTKTQVVMDDLLSEDGVNLKRPVPRLVSSVM